MVVPIIPSDADPAVHGVRSRLGLSAGMTSLSCDCLAVPSRSAHEIYSYASLLVCLKKILDRLLEEIVLSLFELCYQDAKPLDQVYSDESRFKCPFSSSHSRIIISTCWLRVR
jgi:hypothetical protein